MGRTDQKQGCVPGSQRVGEDEERPVLASGKAWNLAGEFQGEEFQDLLQKQGGWGLGGR